MLNNGSAKRKSNIGDLEARKITAEESLPVGKLYAAWTPARRKPSWR
jgi:hypothetical protein